MVVLSLFPIASSSDFYHDTQIFSFSPRQLVKKVPILIACDCTVECTEAFQVQLQLPEKYLSKDIQLGKQSTTKILIQNGKNLLAALQLHKLLPSRIIANLNSYIYFCHVAAYFIAKNKNLVLCSYIANIATLLVITIS